MATQPSLSELMQAANTAPVEGVNFYKEINEAYVQTAANAVQNTPESQIAAQAKQTTIAQQRAELTLDAVMQSREKDLQAHAMYEAEYDPRSADYDLLQTQRRQNLQQLTQEETDPEKNNIFLHPIKTTVSMFRSAQIKEQNNALVNEMNALSDEMSQATKEYISTRQHNAEELAFNLQTQVNLATESALIGAKQAESSAVLRYEDKQKDIAAQMQAVSGLRAVSAEGAARATKAQPTDLDLALYKAGKLGSAWNPVITDAERPQLLRAYTSEGEDVQASVTQAAVRYSNYIKEGMGSTEVPTDFLRREIATSVNGDYARGLDKLTQSRYSEIANIGLEARVQQIAAGARSGDMTGLSQQDKSNPALMAVLKDSKNIADETALQLQIKNALESDFSNSLNQGLQWLKEDMAVPVSSRTVTDARPYVDPASMSAALQNPDYLLAHIPQQYLSQKDAVQIKAEADVVAKVSGMNGGNLLTHKMLAASDFLKKLGVQDSVERVRILRNWMQDGVMDRYNKEGAYSNLAGLTKITSGAKNEEFVVPLVTRESKGAGLFGKYTPQLPSLDLSSPVGLATYLELAEKGVIEQAKQQELQLQQAEKFKSMGGPFYSN